MTTTSVAAGTVPTRTTGHALFFRKPNYSLPLPIPTDAVTRKTDKQIMTAIRWARRNKRCIDFGEHGIPQRGTTAEQAKWNAAIAANTARIFAREGIAYATWATGEFQGPADGAAAFTGAGQYQVLSTVTPSAPAYVGSQGVWGTNLVSAGYGVVGSGVYSQLNIGEQGKFWLTERAASLTYLKARGMSYVRLLLAPERLTPNGPGTAFTGTYWNAIQAEITNALAAGLHVQLCVFSHFKYSFGTSATAATLLDAGVAPFTDAALIDMWVRLAVAYGGEDRISFDLANEPHAMPGTDAQQNDRTNFLNQKLVDAIRTAKPGGVQNHIHIELFPYSNWVTSIAAPFNTTAPLDDPAGPLAHSYSLHCYVDGDRSGQYQKTYDAEVTDAATYWKTVDAWATAGAAVSATPQLAFEMPAPSSTKKVFAHYFPPYPISLDNADPASDYYETGYIAPNGEGGKHSAYGGLLRDRPIQRQPRTDSDYRAANYREEITQAVAAGMDGFLVDILWSRQNTTNPIYDVPGKLLDAAAAASATFKVLLMPDMTAGNPGPGGMSAQQLATELAFYGTHPSVGRLADGRLVVAPYYAEGKTPQYWSDFKAAMLAAGQECALVMCFLDASAANQNAYASVSYGFGNWGNRNPLGNPTTNTNAASPIALANNAHSLNKIWMQPVSVQDCRPNQRIYDESENSQNLRNSWDIATQVADWVQVVTWNDYSESAGHAPSRRHGWAILDLGAYWLSKFRTGAFPTIVRDAIYLSHRTQPFAASPTYTGQTQLMALRSGSSPARNLIEAVVFLTAPATVNIAIGTAKTAFTGAAGLNVFTLALAPGFISAEVVRDTVTVQSTLTPYPATNTPYVQTLDYVYSSSRR